MRGSNGMTSKRCLRIGLIGSGFMGKAHALGYEIARRAFELPWEIELAVLADVDADRAEAASRALGFRRSTGDWRHVVGDPEIDIVDITTPTMVHEEIALAAIASGKHVACEKPLAPRASAARRMAEAAAAAGIVTQVGFNYLKNPMVALAK